MDKADISKMIDELQKPRTEDDYKTHPNHVYHHNDDTPRIAVKVEKNSRSVNWEVSISNATDPDVALSLLHETETRIKAIYEPKPDPASEKEEPLPF